MVHITGSKDCGNSPKNLFAQDVAIALETGEIPTGMLSDDVVWHGRATGLIEGIAAVRQTMAKRPAVQSLVIDHAISHGKAAMANGIATLTDGTIRRFSHVFDFTSAKGNCVATITSYLVNRRREE